ncbi:MAG: hypothetical protein AAGC58_07095 [Asticcacaulis sp.]
MSRFIDRRALMMAFVALCPLGAHAAAPPKKEGAGNKKYVRLAPVALPVVFDGRVVNYVFVSIDVHLTPKADQMKITTQEPMLRDALIRAAHRHSFATREKRDRIDEALFEPVMIGEFSRIAGKGTIKSVEITMQNPQRRQQ